MLRPLRAVLSAAGLALLFAAPAAAEDAAPDWSKSQTIEVAMTNYAFTPSRLSLQHGVVYRLHFTNTSSHDHDFRAPELFDAMTVAPEDRAKVEDGAVEVASGDSVDVRVLAVKPGTYAVDCSHFLHASFGMTGDAEIK